ncbi:hypothetical protein BN77_4195 [Rhizobium mesoamericanum STM3625]|uniref:Uncharacterized protein n=1 Tax=Rhizobium mesoamericanum STM3625 TaxID=1211777 RepID=K0Q3B6_9HYPH|nr:hypothetical protein BN77_4195 [Rhizobium mesoamericanum STM3625]
MVGWAFASEAITVIQAIGATLVIAGIFFASRDRSSMATALASSGVNPLFSLSQPLSLANL